MVLCLLISFYCEDTTNFWNFQIFLTESAINFHLLLLGAGVPVQVAVLDELVGVLTPGLMEHPEQTVKVNHGPPVIKLLGTHCKFLLFSITKIR